MATHQIILDGMVTDEFGLIMLKTASTPDCTLESIKNRISGYQIRNNGNIAEWIARSKEICIEFGLSLFVSKDRRNVSQYDKVKLI